MATNKHQWQTPRTAHVQRIIDGYAQIAQNHVSEGWTPYLLTFMFNHMPGSPGMVAEWMEREIERVYATFVSRVVRKPVAPTSIGRLPVWLCSPDYPIKKRSKSSLRDIVVNDGRHTHAIALHPPWSRFKEPLGIHFEQHKQLYIRSGYPLLRIDVAPVIHHLRSVVGYGLKSLYHGRVNHDSTLILPRSYTEMSD
ncbi:hypothetical protein [Methylobacterium sp. E-045]|uniref:hypothetical protein n=1 Tax=Methylobacterium sp. E-045 TaxID=2836575 RepID=UPI001FB86F87|nr:hypothetical protein [Methylobacterium sp. E-045]MCJ2131198.1 hypothetical protein [Methylobacterium sp. E-045]